MSIASEIIRLQGAKTAIRTSIEGKGVAVPSAAPIDAYSGYIAEIEQSGGRASWTRPSDWLQMPDVVATDQVFYGLHAVYDYDANFATVSATGAYKVDWGDGTIENVASGITAYHNYTYASLPSSSYCSRGYRQALVTVTPQTGHTLSAINLSVKHNQSGLQNGIQSKWLDIRLAMRGAGTVMLNSSLWSHGELEQFEWIGTNAQTNFTSMFQNCGSLQSIPELDTSAGTNFASMFFNCYSLQLIPELDTSAGTNFTYMFYNCFSLQSIPELDTSAGTNFSTMFFNCYNLQTIPAINTAGGTNFTSMFQNCYSLQSIPELNTSAGTNFSSMFFSCGSLLMIPELDASLVTNFSSMFQSCRSLGRSQMKNVNYSHSYTNCSLSAAALNEIYTNLPTVIGQTITVTGNWGTSADNPEIATAKGWTVTG